MGKGRQKNNLKLPFKKKTEGKIECNGMILTKINKRITEKTSMIMEYYKCWNSKRNHKNACRFTGKLCYKIGSQPKNIEIISDHSLTCPGYKKFTKMKKFNENVDESFENEELINPMIQSNNLFEKLDIFVQLHSPKNSDNEDYEEYEKDESDGSHGSFDKDIQNSKKNKRKSLEELKNKGNMNNDEK